MKTKPPQHSTFFLFAGEQSGDIHGGKLIEALRKTRPDLKFTGVGGPRMRKGGLTAVVKMEDFQVMGFTDVFWSFPKLWKNFHYIRDYILELNPKSVILIDYPGFNLRLATALRKNGYTGQIVQYICPSVWAWGKARIDKMAATLDLLLTIYPFEAPYFSTTPLTVKYIGHPLAETIANYTYRDDWGHNLGIKDKEHLIALFPGSREGEILRNFPILLETAKMLGKALPKVQFAISIAQQEHRELINSIVRATPGAHLLDMIFVPGQFNYELMSGCKTAIAKSGTITLELALHGCPTVVVYCLTSVNKLIAKYLLKVNLPYYCIVNILKGKQVFPELIASGCQPNDVFKQVLRLHEEGDYRNTCIDDCKEIKKLLQTSNSIHLAADFILEGEKR